MKKPLASILAVVLGLGTVMAIPAVGGATPATDSLTVVSDNTTMVVGFNYTPITPQPAVYAWEAYGDPPDDTDSFWDSELDYTFPAGADWIWKTYRTEHPILGDVVTFNKTFDIPGTPTSGILHITADNGYEAYVNGTYVGRAQLAEDWFGSDLSKDYVFTEGDSLWQSVESWNITPLLQQGSNTLMVYGVNEYHGEKDGESEGTQYNNPAGLLYSMDVEYESEFDVPVDVKPTSCPNPLNVKGNGVLPVAILGTDSFNVTHVDPASVELEGVAPLRWSLEDVATPFDGEVDTCANCTTDGPDGYLDLTLKFDKQEVVAALGEVEDGACVALNLTGALKAEFGGTPIHGKDMVWIIDKGGNGQAPLGAQGKGRGRR